MMAAFVLLSACTLTPGGGHAQETVMAEGGFIDLPQGRIHAIVRGRGPDLVMIHGANGNARDFSHELIDRLADDFRVIAFDRPGFGFSDSFGGLTSPIDQADLLRVASAQLGVENPLVLGHSYGGAVSMAWALRDGNNVAGLTLLAPATHPWPGELGFFYRFTDTALGQYVVLPAIALLTPRASFERVVARVFRPNPVPDGYVDHLGVDLTLSTPQLQLNAQQINSLRAHLEAMAPGYPALSLPIEVVHGSADRIVGLHLHGERLLEDIESARLTRLRGVGHMPHHARPEAVIEAIHRTAERAGLR